MSSEPQKWSDLAEEASRVLREDERTLAILLFGSAARGEMSETSDLDLLVLHRDEVPEEALDQIDERASITFYQCKRLKVISRKSPLFAIHLAHEGRALWDPDHHFERELRGVGPLSRRQATELATTTSWRLAAVQNDPHFDPADELSAGQLYALAKQAAMIASARRGDLKFNRHAALAELGAIDRKLEADTRRVALLEDAWLARRPGQEERWVPEESVECNATTAAIRVIKQVIDVGS
jgi:predicted nucleotidyltransferase